MRKQHELPVRLTSLYVRIPKTPRTEPGKNDLHYCQRTTASGDCRLRPAGAERSRFGNGTSGWTVRLYVSKGARPIAFTTSSLGRWASIESKDQSRITASTISIQTAVIFIFQFRVQFKWAAIGLHAVMRQTRLLDTVHLVCGGRS